MKRTRNSHTLTQNYSHMKDLWQQECHLCLVDAETLQSVDYMLKYIEIIGKEHRKDKAKLISKF